MLKSRLYIAVSIVFLLTACKKEDPQPAVEYESQGFVKGKITGTSNDNSYTFNDDFNYTQFQLFNGIRQTPYYVINTDGSYTFFVVRSSYNGDITGFFQLKFTLDNDKDISPNNSNLSMIYVKNLSTTQTLEFSVPTTLGTQSLIFPNFEFDKSTGHLSTDYLYSSAFTNTTGKQAEISGSIDIIIKKLVL